MGSGQPARATMYGALALEGDGSAESEAEAEGSGREGGRDMSMSDRGEWGCECEASTE